MPSPALLPFRKQSFGRWRVVVPDAGRDKHGNVLTRCRCRCGSVRDVRLTLLWAGKSESCRECRSPENGRKYGGRANLTHGACRGGRRTVEYVAWCHMRARCNDESHPEYRDYGGRGIKVHPAWKSFSRFLFDVGLRPGRGYSLGRAENDKGYGPGNVRWETKTEQNNNTRRNRLITVDGVTKTLTQWSRQTGVSVNTIRSRLKRGWCSKRAVGVHVPRIYET